MVVNELLQTEKDYIKDLQMCVEEIIEPLQKKQVKEKIISSWKAAEVSYLSLKPFPSFLNQHKPKCYSIPTKIADITFAYDSVVSLSFSLFLSAFPSAEEC